MKHLLNVIHSARKVAEQAEAFFVSSQESPIYFEANRLKQIQTKESTSVSLRIFRDGKLGISTASGSNNMEALLDMAVETSEFGDPANFTFPSRMDYPDVNTFDPRVQKITMEEMIEYGNQVITKIKKYAPDILCDVEVTKGIDSIYIVNSQRGEANYTKSFFGLSVEGILIQDTDMLFTGDSEDSCCLPVSPELIADRVVRQLELANEKAAVSTKLLPVIFTPRGVASTFLTPLALAFNGKVVLEGVSPLEGKLGEQVFDNNLNLWDDATLAYRVGSSPCDDEGTPSQCTPLVERGVVASFLYDLRTAALANTQSTGNCKRIGSGSPKPAMSSLVIEEGDISFEAMVEDMKEGLIVEQLIGADQGNLLGGDFSGNVLLGYKVENGEVVGRIKDTMVSGNVYQVLKQSLGIGNKARWVDGILRTPALYCPCLSVASK